jgi:hypothetical protein
MNTEYVWWAIVLILVGGGAIAFLALGRVPEIGDEPGFDDADEVARESRAETEPSARPGAE